VSVGVFEGCIGKRLTLAPPPIISAIRRCLMASSSGSSACGTVGQGCWVSWDARRLWARRKALGLEGK
jgi:hypothetical protein